MTELPEIDPIEGRQPGHFLNLAFRPREADLREVLRKVWRRRRVIVGTVILLTVLAAIISFQITPRYTARAQVMIEPRQAQVVDVESVLSGLPPDTETINSEIEVLRSTKLAGRVVDRLRLQDDPEFNEALREKTYWSRILDYTRYLPKELVASFTSPAPEAEAGLTRTQVIDALLDQVRVRSKLRSWVIEIAVDSEDPQKAARIANTFADLYLVEQLEAKFEATKVATQWLSSRLSTLRQQLEASEKAVERYRQTAGLVEVRDSVDLVTQQLGELNTQLVLASAKRAESEARLQQVERLIKSRRDVGSVAEVLASPLIQRLLEQESELIRQQGELSSEYGPKHPKMINLKSEIRDLRHKIAAEVDKIVQGLRSEAGVARAREASLKASVKKLEARIGALNQKQVQLKALERDAQANRTLYETFLARFKEITGQNDLQTPDARVISRASVPLFPSFPNKKIIIGLAFVGSLLLGIGLVFVIEQLDAGFRSMEQVEQFTGVPALGLVPQVRSRRSAPPERMVLDEPVSAFSEAIRNLFVGLMLSNVDKPPKTVLITSSMPEEGKSAMAIALGRTVALSGRKTIIVDCDLRRPRLHESLKLPRTPGLVEILAQQATLADAIHEDKASGCHVITAGEHVTNSTDLVGSEQMKRLLTKLAETYDFVIMDSPPVLAVSDARVLASQSDATVFVVRWERTRREAATLGVRQIKAAGGHVAGAVLTRVDVKRNARYGYADSGYYYGKYKKYYTT